MGAEAIIAARLFFFLTIVSGMMLGAETWTVASSEHFVLYTPNKREQAIRLLRKMEATRRNLGPLLSADSTSPRPPLAEARGSREHSQVGAEFSQHSSRVIVVAFRSDSDYADYRPDTAASAYYLEGSERSYIVLGAASARDYAVAVHEYTHHLLHNRYSKLPMWLDEGLAEVFSSVEQNHGELRMGLPPGDRLTSLENSGLLLNLGDLFKIKPSDFAHQRHSEARSRFYAESWLFTEMLRFSPAYEPGFEAFLKDAGRGVPAAQVLLSVYQKNTAQVQADMELYLKQGKFPTERLSLNSSGNPVSEVLARKTDRVEVPAMLAMLLIDLGRFEKAEIALQKLERSSPNDPRVTAAFAYLRHRRSRVNAPTADK